MLCWLRKLYEDAASGRLGHGRISGVLVELTHAAIVIVRESRHDRLAVRAAMLAFWTAVAIVPILLLGFALLGPLGLAETTGQAVRHLLYQTILAKSVEEVGRAIDQLLEATSLRTLGIVGIAGILLIGSQLFFSAELAYNDIFQSRVRRSRLLRMMQFYAAITLAPLGVAAGFLAGARLEADFAPGLLTRGVPVLITATVLVAAIRLLPGRRPGWMPSLAGGLVSATLFEIAKSGFGAYTDLLGTRHSMARIYGSVGFLPVFLLWLYLSWWVVLFGVELAWFLEYRHSLVEAQRRRAVDPHAGRRAASPMPSSLWP